MGSGARILVVDDQLTHRRKMDLAVRALGHDVVAVADGNEALKTLRHSSFDLILLDIMMPDLDGFDVMEFLSKDNALREIPIIVISALDSEMDSVVKAIKLGAQDFLPKSYDPVLLKARIDSSLEKKRNRDRELEYLQQVNRLTDAATILEKELVNPKRLQLDDMSQREDALGKLANVFSNMAQQVYERERKLNQQLRTMRGVGLLLATGVVSGLGVSLSRMAAAEAPHPFGIVLWVNIITAMICFTSAFYRGRMPRMNKSLMGVFLLWALFSSIMGEAVVFWVAQHLQASYIALILVCEGFLVFAFASAMGIEKASWRRLLGFAVGLLGVALVIFATQKLEGSNPWLWALVALIAPIGYAMRTILVTLKLPDEVDMLAATGYSSVGAIILVLPIVIVRDDFIPLHTVFSSGSGVLALAIILFGIVSAAGVTMRVHLIRSAGAVFASQSSFVITFAGIAWGIILLGESLPKEAWIALMLLVIGLLLVGPKEEAEAVDPLTRPEITPDHEL